MPRLGSGSVSPQAPASCEFLYNVYEEIDRGRACGVLFMDLAKVFDMIDHKLIEMLHLLGFKGVGLKWYNSYVQNRKQ